MNLMKFFGLERGIIWGCSILLSCILAISCSQEDECDAQSTNVEAKKAEVMSLAEKYGVTYQLGENLSDKEIADLNLNEMEAFFKSVKELTSKPLPLQLTKEGEAKTPEIITAPLLKTRAEEGSWSGSGNHYDLDLVISVTVSWSKLTDGQLWHTKVSSELSFAPFGYEYAQTNSDSRVEPDDTTMFFSFDGKVTYYKGFVILHGAGALSMKHGTGSVSIY